MCSRSLLDVIHMLIEFTTCRFILTGSSARKLKHGSANLLAGRALVYELYPFASLELNNDFSFPQTLEFGLLPKGWQIFQPSLIKRFLNTYALTYLREEIWNEHLVRNLQFFRKFLEVAAQANGKTINFSKLARVLGVDDKTVRNYFTILEDTLIGMSRH